MSLLLPLTYTGLLKEAKNYKHRQPVDTEDIINRLGFKNLSMQSQAPIVYIVDYSQNKYLYIDPSAKTVLGFENDIMAEAGPGFYTSRMHPEDYKILSNNITPENLQFLKTQIHNDYATYSFTMNYRIKDNKEMYRKILQRHSYILLTESGLPLVSVGFIVDITHFKDNNNVVHTIEKIDNLDDGHTNELILKKTYHPEDAASILSRREKEIMIFISKGVSSKQIAEKLFISVHTVNNHRKNMLTKTNCKTTGELVQYANQLGAL